MIKNWIIRTFFQKYMDMLLNQAVREGSMDAFKKAHADIMETLKDDTDKKAKELAASMLQDMLSPVDWNHVITINAVSKKVSIGGEVADDARVLSLGAEAQMLLSTELWKILHESPKELAQRAMFVAGESLDDMKKGRSMLYTLETQKKILSTLAKFSVK